MLAVESIPLIEQGAFQFILFGLMVIAIFVILWISMAR